MISGDAVLFYLMLGLAVVVVCLVLSHYKFSNKHKETNWLLGGLLFSLLVYITPFGALEPIPLIKTSATYSSTKYSVIIPYQDPEVTKVAPTILRNRQFAVIENSIEATSADEAKEKAKTKFLSGSDSNRLQVHQKHESITTPLKVDVDNNNILAFQR